MALMGGWNMMRTLACLGLVALLSGAAFSQSAETPPAFEVADVHVSIHGTNQFMRGGVLRGTRYELLTATMVDLIKTAYGIDDYKVIGGPSWLEMDRFDVIAKAPPSTPLETLQTMLQALLADRFKLKVHNYTKPLSAYALTLGKRRLELKEADGSGDTGCQPQMQNMQNLAQGTFPYQTYSCHNMTMAAFAARIAGMAPAYIEGKPVVDMTDLKGSWNFTIKWSGRGGLSAAGPDGISIFDAVDKQLGLKLELQKVPMPVIVVDSVHQQPTDNLPGGSQTLQVMPTEFEVVDIKPSDPAAAGRGGRGGGFQPGGRLDVKGITLKNLIAIAWNITSDDLLAGAPKWLDTDKFDIVAKAPATGPPSGPNAAPPVDIDSLRLMVRAMLVDRFKLATHTEDRPVSLYALVVAKSKLKKADESNRAGCKMGNAFGTNGSAPTFTYTCQTTTMAQLVEGLQMASVGDITHPGSDSSALDGNWDFVISWTPRMLAQMMATQGGGRGGDAVQPPGGLPGVAAASDPSGGPSMFEALEKQLGLKLELQKHPMAVLVIDHVEQKPTEN